MKRYGVFLLVVINILLIGIVGCKSAPEEPVPEEPVVVETEKEEPVVEETVPEETVPEETVVEETVPERDWASENNDLTAQVLEARAKALAAGAELYLPDELKVLDLDARESQSVYEDGGDPEVFNTKAKNMLDLYKALEQASFGYCSYERIEGFDFAKYDKTNYDAGNTAALTTEDLFTNGASGKDILESATLAANSYDKVLKAGFTKLANNKKFEAIAVKKQADEIKANVAEKDAYSSAVVFLTRGEQNLTEGEPEVAYKNFSTSFDQLTDVYNLVFQKRQEAQAAIDRAKQKIEASNTKAKEADEIAPIEETDPEQAKAQELEIANEESEAVKDGE